MAKKSAKRRYADPVPPTPEQQERSGYVVHRMTERGQVTGERYQKVRQVEWLLSKDLVTPDEAKALIQYRTYADMLDKSPLRDSLDKSPRGGEQGDIPPAVIHAGRMVGAYEQAIGSLVDLVRFVVVSDKSLSEWAIDKAGAIEDCTEKNGKRVCRLKPRQKAFAIAKLEIRMAARRIIAEMEA